MQFVVALNMIYQVIQKRLRLYTVSFCLSISVLDTFAGNNHHEVVIENMQFAPSVLEVKQGDTIRWVNKDIFTHNAVADTGAFQSTEIASGKSWQWKADKRGRISYLCTLHPTMKARLIVK